MSMVIPLVLLLAIVGIEVWAAFAVIFGRGSSGWLRLWYFVIALLALVGALLMTSFFSYYANPNTHVFGWPVPRVIFQRDTATSPWLDYVGATIVLAYPLNFILYMFFPSAVFSLLVLRRRKHNKSN